MKKSERLDRRRNGLLAVMAGIMAAAVGLVISCAIFGVPEDSRGWLAFWAFGVGAFAGADVFMLAALNNASLGETLKGILKSIFALDGLLGVLGGFEARPLFNLHIKRVYDGAPQLHGVLGFEPMVEAFHEAISFARHIIGEEVHIDEKGRIWPGYRSGLPIRFATLNVAEHRGKLSILQKAFMDNAEQTDYALAPHIHVEAESGDAPDEIFMIFFSGRRPYLYEINRAAVEGKKMGEIAKKLA